jgi:organic radical activating enzyme
MIEFKDIKDELDQVGCGFCLAKWSQVTIHLASGINHSCHHVAAHKIPLDELAKNPNALHNTQFKKNQRRMMLKNQRPPECDYCWRIEDNTNEYSDRVIKSSAKWSQIDKEKIIASDWMDDIYPRYVEISFSNVCNFKCAYCGPPFSSKWAEEIKQHGFYKLKRKPYNRIREEEVPIPEREENPYIDAFWKWFPEAVKHMLVFRITGGEPLLSKHTKKVIQYLRDNPQPQLEFAINTNACPPDKLWEEFVDSIRELEENNCVKNFQLYTSAESFGKQAEYVRYGMNFKLFEKNLKYFIKNTHKARVFFMSAFNILSLPTLIPYLRFLVSMKRMKENTVFVDWAYVRHPEFLDIKVADKQLIEKYLEPALDFMKERKKNSNRFMDHEIWKLKRIYEDCLTNLSRENDYTLEYCQFWQFVNEYDKRRGTNFLETFPEFKNFYKKCGVYANV